MEAVTVEISSGISVAVVRSSIRISMAKIAPAMGAWKMPAMAPAAPQAMSRVVVL